MNARSILIHSLIFGFALTAAAQVFIELPFNSGRPNFLARVALAILAPGQFAMTAATFGMLSQNDVWLALAVNVLIWATVAFCILLIRSRLARSARHP